MRPGGLKSFPRPGASNMPPPNQSLATAGKYSPIPAVLVRKYHRLQSWRAWLDKELKEGGYLNKYLEREKALTPARYRSLARRLAKFKQNNKSDFRVRAHVPARDFFRWRHTDPHFFDDNANLKSLKRNNPDVLVYD